MCLLLSLALFDAKNCDVDELVKHALKALSGCVTGDKELDAQGATLAIVGKVILSPKLPTGLTFIHRANIRAGSEYS